MVNRTVHLAQNFSKQTWAIHSPSIYNQQGTLTAGKGKL